MEILPLHQIGSVLSLKVNPKVYGVKLISTSEKTKRRRLWHEEITQLMSIKSSGLHRSYLSEVIQPEAALGRLLGYELKTSLPYLVQTSAPSSLNLILHTADTHECFLPPILDQEIEPLLAAPALIKLDCFESSLWDEEEEELILSPHASMQSSYSGAGHFYFVYETTDDGKVYILQVSVEGQHHSFKVSISRSRLLLNLNQLSLLNKLNWSHRSPGIHYLGALSMSNRLHFEYEEADFKVTARADITDPSERRNDSEQLAFDLILLPDGNLTVWEDEVPGIRQTMLRHIVQSVRNPHEEVVLRKSRSARLDQRATALPTTWDDVSSEYLKKADEKLKEIRPLSMRDLYEYCDGIWNDDAAGITAPYLNSLTGATETQLKERSLVQIVLVPYMHPASHSYSEHEADAREYLARFLYWKQLADNHRQQNSFSEIVNFLVEGFQIPSESIAEEQ